MFYRVFFADGTTLDLRTLIDDPEGRPVRGTTIYGDSILIGSYKYITTIVPKNSEVVSKREAGTE